MTILLLPELFAADLKTLRMLGKEHHIKEYYKMRKSDLLDQLHMKFSSMHWTEEPINLVPNVNLYVMNMQQLRAVAKKEGLKRYSKMRRDELCNTLNYTLNDPRTSCPPTKKQKRAK